MLMIIMAVVSMLLFVLLQLFIFLIMSDITALSSEFLLAYAIIIVTYFLQRSSVRASFLAEP